MASTYKSGQDTEQGYVLLTLLLIVSLMIIATAVIVPSVAFEIRREREMELVHRGVQYTRAIRLFSKRNGRYPSRPEELLGQADVRYIRKLYKDPITGKDFRLLHLGDIQPATTPNGLGTPIGAAADSNPDQSGQSSPLTPAQSSDQSSAAQLSQGQAGDALGNPVAASSPAPPPDPSQGPVVNFGQANARYANQASGAFGSGGNSATAFGGGTSTFSAAPSGDGQQPGLLIFGVASTSKAKTIRSFDHKEHYNEWWFFYDPRFDRGYEIKGPTSMSMPTFQNPALAGQSSNGQTLNGQTLNGAQPSQPQTFQFQPQQTQQAQPQQPAPETQQNPPQ